MKHLPQKRHDKNRGTALIMTLMVMAMLTILIVAYLSTARTELLASHAFADTQRAKMVSQGAVSHAIELLRANIPDPALISESAETAPGENWAVNPGRLTVFSETGDERVIPLHTGAAETAPGETTDPDVHSADLNEPLPGEKFPPIAMALDNAGRPMPDEPNPAMRVRWLPVLKTPAEEATEDNPITGRYAFWMDDESAKINFNVALGKPDRSHDPEGFFQQYEMGLMTPLFRQGRGDVEYNAGSSDREWALGKLRSINLDTLFDDPDDLLRDQLLAHAWLRGFSRYPEAILDFVDVPDRDSWYHGNKFNLTFYSRGPEFNAFGRPRFFTTNIPLSLEAGPLYQLPFVYNGPGAPPTTYQIDGILHLHSLMGGMGFTHRIHDGRLGWVHAANIVNRAEFEMLRRYMQRIWPGYDRSFVDKYGEKECYQLALNMLTFARMATTTMAGGGRNASRDWAWRSTSVIYAPHERERPWATPERHYWQVELENGDTVPMLPQTPGPHITEVRLIMRPVRSGSPVRYRIQYRYEIEYYMHGYGPVLLLNYFPAKIDYMQITARGGGQNITQEFGPPTAAAGRSRPDRDWDHRRNLGRLRASASGNQRIGGLGTTAPNRVIVSSPTRSIGRIRNEVPGSGTATFNSTRGRRVQVDVKWRLGMGVRPDRRRPRQMIPIGENPGDTLDASFELDLRSGAEKVVSWQISDPRLSWDLSQWIRTANGGSPGRQNPMEPGEFSSEKSKFRYIQRGPGSVQDPLRPGGRRFNLHRPDEYNSRSRISSKGYWSVLHTGIQNLEPWRTMNLGGGGVQDDPPDWLLLDLLGATYPMQHDQWRINSTLPDEFSTVSFMNSTAGQINLNSRIYPESSHFKAPERRKPLEAVFKHLRSESEIRALIDGVIDYQDNNYFQYIGDLAKANGFLRPEHSATQFQHEELIRNMAGCVTTKSNTFGLWGVAQVVQKTPGNDEWGEFEDGDRVQAEKRFHAIIERYLWPGKDGIPGNGHVNATGRWDRIASQSQSTASWSGQTTDTLYQLPGSPPMRKGGGNRLALDLNGTYPWYDGPQEVEMDRYASRVLGKVRWTESSLEDAYNPPQPVVKYRVVYFKYLDE